MNFIFPGSVAFTIKDKSAVPPDGNDLAGLQNSRIFIGETPVDKDVIIFHKA